MGKSMKAAEMAASQKGSCRKIAATLNDQRSKRVIGLSTIIAKQRSTVDEFAEIILKEAGVAVRPQLFDDRASELRCSSAADIRDKAVQLL